MQRSATIPSLAIPATNGHLPFVVQAAVAEAAAKTLPMADAETVASLGADIADRLTEAQAAAASADRYIAREYPAVAELLADDNARQHPESDTPCPAWPGLCTDQTPGHYDHHNHEHSGASAESPVSIGFVQSSGSAALLYIDNGLAEDFPPEDAPKVAEKLRAAADRLEEFQYRAQVGRALERMRKVRETAGEGFAEVLTIMEEAIVRDGADPHEVGEQILGIIAKAQAARAGRA